MTSDDPVFVTDTPDGSEFETFEITVTCRRGGLRIWMGRDSDGEAKLTLLQARALRDWLVANVRD